MLPFLLPATLFGLVLFVGYLKTRGAIRVLRWVADTPDRTMRRLATASLAPAVAVAIYLMARGLPPPPSLAAAGLFYLGTFVALAGVLGVEGALVEPGSEAAARVAMGAVPKSTRSGRAISMTIGLILAAGAGAILWWMSQV
jgi:hypothetical protein